MDTILSGITMCVKLIQNSNAQFPIDVTLWGIVTLTSLQMPSHLWLLLRQGLPHQFHGRYP